MNLFNVIIISIAAFIISCGSERSGGFNDSGLQSKQYNNFVVFDLRNDAKISAAIVVSKGGNETGLKHIVLNFAVKHIEKNRQIFSTSSVYDDFSLIDYEFNENSPRQSLISIEPYCDELTDDDVNQEKVSHGISIYRKGLFRKFIYIPSKKLLEGSVRQIKAIQIDAIAVLLPENSRGIEIGNSKKTSKPDVSESINEVMFFSKESIDSAKTIEIQYEFEETKSQEIVFTVIIKILLTLVPFVILLIVLKTTDIQNFKLRKTALIIAIVFTILLIIGLGIYNQYFGTARFLESISEITTMIFSIVINIVLYKTVKK